MAFCGAMAFFAGCNSFKQPDEKNFMAALNAYYPTMTNASSPTL